MPKRALARVEKVRILTKSEIDRRLDEVVAEILADAGRGGEGPLRGPGQPLMISAAELVRKVRPFLVYN